MNVVAKITSEWRKRMIFIIVFILAAGGWFLYDGFIGYPKKQQRYANYQEFVTEFSNGGATIDETDVAFRKAWNEEAFKRGLKREVPKDATAGDIREQKIIGGAMGLIGLGVLIWFGISSKREVKADEDTIYSDTGTPVKFTWVDAIDDKKWKSKGIVYAYYHENGADDGKRLKLTLDDYKYGGTIAIIKRLCEQLDQELPS